LLALNVSDRIARITLSRAPVNAINDQLLAQFHAAIDDLLRREDWNVLMIESSLKVFCAGADLAQMSECIETEEGADKMVQSITQFQALFSRIETLPGVTLAVISGAALGGGFELALACDLRIVAHEAKLGLPEASLGVIPGAGGTQRLTRLCGQGIANRLILTAEVIDGQSAEQLGIAQWSVPREDLNVRAQEIVVRLAGLSRMALSESKACIAAASQLGPSGFSMELEATRRLYQARETQERVRSFLEKNKRK
jgi:enoyl-CoA hydratase